MPLTLDLKEAQAALGDYNEQVLDAVADANVNSFEIGICALR